jgi:uncharacterized protein (TIGR03437 family)
LRAGFRFWVLFTILTAAWGQAPTISLVTNYALFPQGDIVAPGELLSIFGVNLGSSNSIVDCTPLSTTCGGTSVQIGGVAAYLVSASATWLAVMAPYELSGGTVALQVTTSNGQSSPLALTVAPASPGIYTGIGGVVFNDCSNNGCHEVTSANPASPGDLITSYAYGLGITVPAVTDGALVTQCCPAPAATVSVTVGGLPAEVLFAGLIPGLVGTYQVNCAVPAGLLGNQPVIFTADGIASPPVTIPLVAGTPSALSVTTASDLGTFPLGEIQLGLNASGGNGSYTWSVASGSTLPPGLALRGDLPAYVTPFAPEGLIGVATTPGTYNFTLSVASGTSTATQDFAMKVTPLVLKDGPNLPDGFLGTPYYGNGYQLAATDNGVPANITCTSSTTNGITLSIGCLLSGTPAATGAQSIQVTFTDGTDTVTKVLTLNVYAVQIASPGLLPNASQNAAYSYTLTAGGGTGPYTYSVDPLPDGLALNAGVISGTPDVAPGKYSFAITVTDSASHSYTKNMALDVAGSPDVLPQISPYGDLGDCTIGMGCTRAIGVSGGGVAPFTWSVSGLPPGMGFRSGSSVTLAYVSPGDLELWGTPTAIGNFNVIVQAVDAMGLSVTRIFPLKVSALFVGECLSAAGCSGMPNGTVQTAYASAFRVVGGVPPYTAALAPSENVPAGLPAGLWLSPTAVSGIPLEGGLFAPLLLFADSSGGPNTLTAPQSLLVAGASGTSTIVNDYPTQYATLGQPYSLQLGACCAATYNWSQAGGTPAPGIALSNTGLLSGAATLPGTYHLLVQATESRNAGNYGTRQLTVVETPISLTSASTLPPGNVNAPYSQALGASGATGSLTWSLAAGNLLPPGLSLNAASGAIAGIPTTSGVYTFNVLATDSAKNMGFGNFSILIYTACDLNENRTINVADAQHIINEALGVTAPANDVNADGVVNVVDVQIVTNAGLGLGCAVAGPATLALTGLVGWWTFDTADISGTTAFDRSGLGNNGLIYGATPTTGILGQALAFDGYRSTVSPFHVGAWAHVVVTFDSASGAPHLYVNGIEVAGTFDSGTKLRTPNQNPAYGFNIGATGNPTPGTFFAGSIDDVRIYNRVLSATEVQQLFSGT